MKEFIVEIHLWILDVCGLCIATDSNFLICKLFKLSDIFNTARSEAVINAKAIHFAKAKSDIGLEMRSMDHLPTTLFFLGCSG